MKKILLLVSCFVCTAVLLGDDMVINVKGRKAVLHDNFTWEYLDMQDAPDSEGPLALSFDASIINPFVSKNGKYKIYIDTEKWRTTSGLNDDADFQFVNSDQTGFGLLLFDGLPIPLDSMKDILIVNANNIDPNARILDVRPCTVNGSEGEIVTYTARASGLEFIFHTFITTNENGTIQFTFYTLSSVFGKLKPLFEEAIAGLVFE